MNCRVFYVNSSHSIAVNTINGDGRLCRMGTLAGHSKNVRALSYSDERRLLASCDEEELLFWDMDSRCLVRQLRIVTALLFLHRSHTSSVFSGSGPFFALVPARAISIAGTLKTMVFYIPMVAVVTSTIIISTLTSTTPFPSQSNSPISATPPSPFPSLFILVTRSPLRSLFSRHRLVFPLIRPRHRTWGIPRRAKRMHHIDRSFFRWAFRLHRHTRRLDSLLESAKSDLFRPCV